MNKTKNQTIRDEALQIYRKIGRKTKTGKSITPYSEPFIGKYNREYRRIYKQVKATRQRNKKK